MYGGSSPGGLVNAVSKLPPAAPIRYLEAGVNNFGNAYTQFDFGGPVATQPGNGTMLYRIVGQVQGGGTQTELCQQRQLFHCAVRDLAARCGHAADSLRDGVPQPDQGTNFCPMSAP